MKQTKDTKSKPTKGSTNRPTKGHATTAERLEALKRYYVNGYSIKILASQYQVTSCTIRNWIRIFEQENPEVAKAMNKKRIPPRCTPSEELSKGDCCTYYLSDLLHISLIISIFVLCLKAF